MFRLVVCLALCAVAAAFTATGAVRSSRVTLSMKNDVQKIFAAGLVGASVFLGGNNARAEIDYDGIKYLGGGDKIDLNKVWTKQSISPELISQIAIWAKEVNDLLHSTSGGRMVSEWAKKSECKDLVLGGTYSQPSDNIYEIQ